MGMGKEAGVSTEERDRMWERSTQGRRFRDSDGLIMEVLRVGRALGEEQPLIGFNVIDQRMNAFVGIDLTLEQAADLRDALAVLIAPPQQGGERVVLTDPEPTAMERERAAALAARLGVADESKE